MRTDLLEAIVKPADDAELPSLTLALWPENASGERLARVRCVDRRPRDGALTLTCQGVTGRLFDVDARLIRVLPRP